MIVKLRRFAGHWTSVFTATGALVGGYMIATGRPGMVAAGAMCAITGICMSVVIRDAMRKRT